jgi:ADP-ribosylglycohydrolase
MEPVDRYRGSLLGLAVGDAVGTTLEFRSPGTFTPINDMVGGGPFRLKPGQWTDDTSMALCLAESLIECRGFHPEDQMRRYVKWWREGYLSSTGTCFEIGTTTSQSLARFEQTGEPFSGSKSASAAGNGSIMRLAPVPMFYAGDPAEAIAKAAESSRTTHAAANCVDACRCLAAIIVGALRGEPKERLLSSRYAPVVGCWGEQPLTPEIDEIACGSFKEKQPPEIKGSGYVVSTLEAALWAFHHTDSFRDGCLMVVNLGDDADTTGAVYGQIAGAYYGESGIPAEWRAKIAMAELIRSFADELYQLGSVP